MQLGKPRLVRLSPVDKLKSLPKSIFPKQFTAQTLPEFATFLLDQPRNFYEVDPLEMARQLTLMEFEDYYSVKAHECLDQIWLERKKKEFKARNAQITKGATSPNIMKMIKHTNLVRPKVYQFSLRNYLPWETTSDLIEFLVPFLADHLGSLLHSTLWRH